MHLEIKDGEIIKYHKNMINIRTYSRSFTHAGRLHGSKNQMRAVAHKTSPKPHHLPRRPSSTTADAARGTLDVLMDAGRNNSVDHQGVPQHSVTGKDCPVHVHDPWDQSDRQGNPAAAAQGRASRGAFRLQPPHRS